MRKISNLWCLAVMLTACAQMPAAPPMPPAPPEKGVQLVAGPYVVPAGKEKYFCYAMTLNEAAQVAITKVESFQGVEVHHLAAFKTLLPEPDGFSECPVIIKNTWIPVYANGTGNHAMPLPPGAGFPLKQDEQLLVQLHLLNSSEVDVDASTYVNFTFAKDASSVTPAGIWARGELRCRYPGQDQRIPIAERMHVGKEAEHIWFLSAYAQPGAQPAA